MNVIQLTPKDVPVVKPSLYREDLDGFLLLCNPINMNGVYILDSQARRIFEACCGDKSIEEISLHTGYDQLTVANTVAGVFDARLITIDGKKPERRFRKKYPEVLHPWFHVTNKCNLSCYYCFIGKNNESMSYETVKRAIDGLIKSAVLHNISYISVRLAGGEPLLELSLIRQIISYARKQGAERGITFRFGIITNGLLLSEEVVELIQSEALSISVSLDGIGEYHNCQRGGFDKVEAGISTLLQNEIDPYILVTVTERNMLGLPQLTEYLLQRGLSFRYSFLREINPSRIDSAEHLGEFNRRAITVLHECYDIIEANLPEKKLARFHKLCDMDITMKRRRNCGICENSLAIGHRGQIALCQSLLDKPVGSVYSGADMISAIQDQPDFRTDVYSVDQNSVCNDCAWRYICTGGCPLVTTLHNGNLNGKSPFCEIYKEMIPRLIRITGKQVIKKIPKESGVALV